MNLALKEVVVFQGRLTEEEEVLKHFKILEKQELHSLNLTFACDVSIQNGFSRIFEEGLFWTIGSLRSLSLRFDAIRLSVTDIRSIVGFIKALKHLRCLKLSFGFCNLDVSTMQILLHGISILETLKTLSLDLSGNLSLKSISLGKLWRIPSQLLKIQLCHCDIKDLQFIFDLPSENTGNRLFDNPNVPHDKGKFNQIPQNIKKLNASKQNNVVKSKKQQFQKRIVVKRSCRRQSQAESYLNLESQTNHREAMAGEDGEEEIGDNSQKHIKDQQEQEEHLRSTEIESEQNEQPEQQTSQILEQIRHKMGAKGKTYLRRTQVNSSQTKMKMSSLLNSEPNFEESPNQSLDCSHKFIKMYGPQRKYDKRITKSLHQLRQQSPSGEKVQEKRQTKKRIGTIVIDLSDNESLNQSVLSELSKGIAAVYSQVNSLHLKGVREEWNNLSLFEFCTCQPCVLDVKIDPLDFRKVIFTNKIRSMSIDSDSQISLNCLNKAKEGQVRSRILSEDKQETFENEKNSPLHTENLSFRFSSLIFKKQDIPMFLDIFHRFVLNLSAQMFQIFQQGRLVDEKDGRGEKRDKLAEKQEGFAEKQDVRAEKKDRLAQKKDRLAQKKDRFAEKKDGRAEKKDGRAEKKDGRAENKSLYCLHPQYLSQRFQSNEKTKKTQDEGTTHAKLIETLEIDLHFEECLYEEQFEIITELLEMLTLIDESMDIYKLYLNVKRGISPLLIGSLLFSDKIRMLNIETAHSIKNQKVVFLNMSSIDFEIKREDILFLCASINKSTCFEEIHIQFEESQHKCMQTISQLLTRYIQRINHTDHILSVFKRDTLPNFNEFDQRLIDNVNEDGNFISENSFDLSETPEIHNSFSSLDENGNLSDHPEDKIAASNESLQNKTKINTFESQQLEGQLNYSPSSRSSRQYNKLQKNSSPTFLLKNSDQMHQNLFSETNITQISQFCSVPHPNHQLSSMTPFTL